MIIWPIKKINNKVKASCISELLESSLLLWTVSEFDTLFNTVSQLAVSIKLETPTPPDISDVVGTKTFDAPIRQKLPTLLIVKGNGVVVIGISEEYDGKQYLLSQSHADTLQTKSHILFVFNASVHPEAQRFSMQFVLFIM